MEGGGLDLFHVGKLIEIERVSGYLNSNMTLLQTPSNLENDFQRRIFISVTEERTAVHPGEDQRAASKRGKGAGFHSQGLTSAGGCLRQGHLDTVGALLALF